MGKQVYLVNISGSYQILVPYSCGLLEAYCRKDPEIEAAYSFQDYIFHVPNTVEEIAERVTNPEILGLSLLSWNFKRSLKLARLVKERYPECLTIVGGPEAPDDAADFLKQNRYIDIVVHKEGEESFLRILKEKLKSRPDWESLSGVTYRVGDEVFKKPRTHGFLNPVDTPSPYLMGLFESSLAYVDKVGLPRISVWETNRGCPYSCTFCDWGSAVNQKLRILPVERVNAEIDYIGEHFDEIHLADANFGILARDVEFAKRLHQAMVEKGRLKSVHLNYVKTLNENVVRIAEMLEALKLSRAGFTFSFQSLDADTLKNIKRWNVTPEKFRQVKKYMDERDIPTNAELILPLPGETRTSFLNGVDLCLSENLTDLRTYQLVMYPNSEMNNPETIEQFQLKTEKILIVQGATEDESEYVDTVMSSRDMSREQVWFLKKMIEMIEQIHLGKWAYYLAWYAKRAKGIRLVDFYERLAQKMFADPEALLGQIARGDIINRYNSGYYNAYKGPHSPFNVDWGNNFFRKSTFYWLVIAEQRELFFRQMKAFMSETVGMDEQVEDLIRFQDDMIISFDYDPQIGKVSEYGFDWLSYFFGDAKDLAHPELKKIQLSFGDDKVGRFEYPIRPRDPQSYFYVAGGYSFHHQKMNAFDFKKVRLCYSQDSHTNRFQHKPEFKIAETRKLDE